MNMTYLCVCMSPAIDASVSLGRAPQGDGEIFKNVKVVENAGGKAINVARWIRSRALSFAPSSTRSLSRPEDFLSEGSRALSFAPSSTRSLSRPEDCRVICAGLLGEDNATLFEKEFAKYGIVDKMMRVKGATRRNEMITWPVSAKTTPGKSGEAREMRSFKLNQAAFEGVEFDEDRFLEGLVEQMSAAAVVERTASVQQQEGTASIQHQEVVIISGSLPKCCSNDFYAKAVAAFKATGAFVVLDASGEAMARALRGGEGRTAKPVDYGRDGVPSPSARPDLIKPNDEECEALIGFVPKTPEEFKKATAMLRGELATAKGELLLGAEHVVISAGGAGAWFDGEFFAAPKVEVVDTTAAGDTLLAEYCWQLREAELANQDMAARFAVAAGSAACTMPGSNPPPVELVEKMS